MKYKAPHKTGYTVYSISGCKYCDMCKEFVKNTKKKTTFINCDDFIQTLRNRDDFYKFIHKFTIIPYIHFPMIFYDGKFIGGYKELTGK